jgi:NosR/NirI family nitrous oxide reductase transcriptional regulator
LIVAIFFDAHAAAEPGIRDTTVTHQDIQALFPRATRIGDYQQSPPVWPVYQLQELLGYAFESRRLVNYSGFSGDPINLLIGIDTSGRFTGARVLQHHEPIFLHGLGPQALNDYVDQYAGIRLTDRIILKKPEGGVPADSDGTAYFDAVTKATVSIIVVNDTVLSSALKVARQTLEAFAQRAPSVVRPDLFDVLDWQQLLERGLVKHWSIRRAEVEQALGRTLDDYPETRWSETPEAASTDIYFAYLNAPTIGRNLLGDDDYQRLLDNLRDGESALLLMSGGFYDAISPEFRAGTIPERFNLLQNGLPMPLRDIDFFRTGEPRLIDAAPVFDSIRVLRIRPSSGFDPAAPMQLQIRFDLKKNHLIGEELHLDSTYSLPPAFFTQQTIAEEIVPEPAWLRIWRARQLEIGVLLVSLVLVSMLFIRQDGLMTSARRFKLIRWGFLWFTLLFIGFYSQGQLSVVNVFTLLTEMLKGFDIRVFLLDPVIFMLWSFTALTLLIWGRGVFCGWLCPFGALQEMVAWLAARLRIRQWRLSDGLHCALLKLKYLILFALTALSLVSLDAAMRASEVEPFKTAITLVFVRDWPFVLYAVLLLALGLFINKAYCRYLCPLGAGLALLGRLHWLKSIRRREECGARCQMCRNRCQVNAIHDNGAIDYSECVQCLECVAIINDPRQCAIDLLTLKQSQRPSTTAAGSLPT